MNMPVYAVYGASGFGREIMPLARDELNALGVSPDRLVFIDDEPSSDVVNGYRVVHYADFLAIPATSRHVAIAIANSVVREKLVARLTADGVTAWALRANNAVCLDDVEVGEGALLCHFTLMTSNVRIGKYFHANVYSYVAHDCVIGDYVTFAPSVKCNGNIVVEDHAYIGTGAILKQGRPGKPLVIGKGAVVGMGAVVTKDVPPGVTVVGNPAKPLVKS